MYHHLPINIDIAGTVDSIYSITKEHLYTCYETFYHPSNMILFVAGAFNVTELATLIETNQANKPFSEQQTIDVYIPDEPNTVVTTEKIIELPVSMPKVTIGIKAPNEQLIGAELIKRECIQEIVLDYLFAPSGQYYEQLQREQLIDDSFEYSTSVDQYYNFSLISCNTNEPEKFIERIHKLLTYTKTLSIDETTFMTMKRKKIGELLRSMNSLEQMTNEFVQYYFLQFDYFDKIPFIQNISLTDVHDYVREWISADRITTFIVQRGT